MRGCAPEDPIPRLPLAGLALASALAIMAITAPTARAATVVSACGQTLPRSAELDADLDCTCVDDCTVVMKHGTLALTGFTIRGGLRSCATARVIVGPGTITASAYFDVNAYQSALRITNGQHQRRGLRRESRVLRLATCTAPPRLKQGSTCEHSYVVESGDPGNDWGVCALD